MLGSSLVLRLQLSRANHRSLAGHPRMARFLASLVPGYAFDDDRVFRERLARALGERGYDVL